MGTYNERDLAIWETIFADVPDEWRAAPPSMAMETCAAWLREVGSREVLDLGCGIGRWSVWLVKQGFRVWGSDFSPTAVEVASAWAADEGIDIPFVRAPITERAFPERGFDAVVAALVLDLVSTAELKAALDVLHATLRPTGHLVAVFNPLQASERMGENPTSEVTLVTYSDAEIERIVGGAGFRLVDRAELDVGTRGFLWRRVAEQGR